MDPIEANLGGLSGKLGGMSRLLRAPVGRVPLQAQEIATHGGPLGDPGHEPRGLRDKMRAGLQRARKNPNLRLGKLGVDVGAVRTDAIEEQFAG